ncbi:MAG TPA: GNAT family N-acetyltransferase [Anaerolineales bacterium]|nr:GNAT family N-acetyltransferase [Anaerolineales bacterium]
MPAIQIRTAVATDVPHLMGIDHSSSSEYVWQLELRRQSGEIVASFRDVRLPRPIALTYPHDPFALGDEWMHMAALLVALDGKDAVGYMGLTERPSSGVWVTDMVVTPAWRRQGVATALLESARAWTEQQEYRRMFLEMQSKNQPAIRLAQKHGFEFCGYNDHYYATQDVALFFVRAV